MKNGKLLSGAKLVLKDENGKTIDTWISNKETHKIEGLKVGNEYILTEKESPYGYKVAEPITFKAIAGTEGQLVEMKDEPIVKKIKIIKVDSETKESIKSYFKFGIYEDIECTKLIKEVEADQENGTVIFEDLKYGTYYIKEIEAPEGYSLSNKIIKIEIKAKGVFVDGKLFEEQDSIVTITFYNRLIPKIQTGNERNYWLVVSNILFSLVVIIFFSRKYI